MKNERSREIFIADDDSGVRDMLFFSFRHAGWSARTFSDGPTLLAATQQHLPACILLDVNMPAMSGLEVLKRLRGQGYDRPVVMISGVGDIPMAVEAMRNGAQNFIQKPFRAPDIVVQVAQIVNGDAGVPAGIKIPGKFPGRDLLTPRETEVLAQVVRGVSNKEAGRTLGISPRTVEVHRSKIFEKIGAKNSVDLMRIMLSAS